MKRRINLLILGLILAAGSCLAHDIWMMGEPGLWLTQGGILTLKATVGGQFPQSELAIATDRIEESYLLDPEGKKRELDWKAREKWTEAVARIDQPGTYYALLVQRPRYIELTAEEFSQYLEHEGLPQVKQLRETLGLQNQPGREIYTRYVKALIYSQGGEREGVARPLGLKIEIVPQILPFLGEVAVQVFFEGHPLRGQTLLYGTGQGEFKQAITDERGEAVLNIDSEGIWLVKTIHMIYRETPHRLGDDEANWMSYWATLTFEIK